MAGQSKITTDHGEIQSWAEKRGGKPAVVKDTKGKGEGVGMLRINFPGYAGRQSLEEITWEDFFDTFEKSAESFDAKKIAIAVFTYLVAKKALPQFTTMVETKLASAFEAVTSKLPVFLTSLKAFSRSIPLELIIEPLDLPAIAVTLISNPVLAFSSSFLVITILQNSCAAFPNPTRHMFISLLCIAPPSSRLY